MRTKLCIFIALMLVFAGMLSACSCQHEWIEADCITPKTCSKCGETEGEPLGHVWTDATCFSPKTCTVCGLTEGDALEHNWEFHHSTSTCIDAGANIYECTLCGEIKKEPGVKTEHKYVDCWCRVCGKLAYDIEVKVTILDGSTITYPKMPDAPASHYEYHKYALSENQYCVSETNGTFYFFKLESVSFEVKDGNLVIGFLGDKPRTLSGDPIDSVDLIYTFNGKTYTENAKMRHGGNHILCPISELTEGETYTFELDCSPH